MMLMTKVFLCSLIGFIAIISGISGDAGQSLDERSLFKSKDSTKDSLIDSMNRTLTETLKKFNTTRPPSPSFMDRIKNAKVKALQYIERMLHLKQNFTKQLIKQINGTKTTTTPCPPVPSSSPSPSSTPSTTAPTPTTTTTKAPIEKRSTTVEQRLSSSTTTPTTTKFTLPSVTFAMPNTLTPNF